MIKMNDGEWGPWTTHYGGGRPIPIGVYVEIEKKCGCKTAYIELGNHDDVVWNKTQMTTMCMQCRASYARGTVIVVRYRVFKPRGVQIIEGVLREVTRGNIEKQDA